MTLFYTETIQCYKELQCRKLETSAKTYGSKDGNIFKNNYNIVNSISTSRNNGSLPEVLYLHSAYL